MCFLVMIVKNYQSIFTSIYYIVQHLDCMCKGSNIAEKWLYSNNMYSFISTILIFTPQILGKQSKKR